MAQVGIDSLVTKHQETQRPITADQVSDGKLLVQLIYNHQGQRLVWNGLGDAASFVMRADVRRKFVWTLLAACVSMISALRGLEPAEIEAEPTEEASPLFTPTGARAPKVN